MSVERFLEAQEGQYEIALSEIRAGRKLSHWIWYIFPQLKGLGHSYMSQHYGIEGKAEAREYLQHPILSKRLIEISEVLLGLDSNDAREIMGSDDKKLRSSMTLFYAIGGGEVFQKVLDKFFASKPDYRTMKMLEKEQGSTI